jgi:hypothetical protein
MPTKFVDPNLGFISFDFVADKADGSPPDAVLDAYEACDLYDTVKAEYLKELEAAGKNHLLSYSEIHKRWAKVLMPEWADKLSLITVAAVHRECLMMVNGQKKAEPESGTPG